MTTKIQIINANHFDWYDQFVGQTFSVADVNEEDQTLTIITYDAYGKRDDQEVNISDCKILEP